MRDAQQRARIEKEFDDLHVLGDAVLVQVPHIVQRHVVAEETFDQGLQEPPLEFTMPLWRA
jgi:hypothetical protein